jgi:hypothetical protein
MNNATNTATLTLHVAGDAGELPTNVWVEGVPGDWTDGDVQAVVEGWAAKGVEAAIAACRVVGSCWVDLSRGDRVYYDHA